MGRPDSYPPRRSGPGGPGGPDRGRPGGRPGGGDRFGPPRGGPRDNRGPGGPPRGGPGRGFDDRRPAPKPPGTAPDVVHRDRDLLIVIKKPGQPNRGAPGVSLVTRVNDHLAGRRERYRPVHDLDDVASGLVAMVPITEDDDLREIRSQATYLALVEGEVDTGDTPERSITGPVPGLATKSSAPVTTIRKIASANGVSLVRVRARPDAPGQVRAHLASAGHPVVGDTEHGSHRDDVKRVAIHAEEIRLRHPGTHTTARYRCPTPASFYRAAGANPPANTPEADVPQAQNQGWDQVAGWYDDLITSGSSDHHEQTVLPGAERLLDIQPGERLLDIACGQGAMAARIVRRGGHGEIVGVDASPALIEAAKKSLGDKATLLVGDARALPLLMQDHGFEPFDAAACVLALMNIDDLDAVCRGVSRSLKPGGRFVAVILHPAFRSPQTTAWGWTVDGRSGVPVQFRRVDRYLNERASEIIMNPGQAAAGKPAVTTTTYHRPIGAYITALGEAGLPVDTVEEWSSQRVSNPGPRAEAENLARAEIPMFLALRARKAL